MEPARDRDLRMPAGRVLGVILIALAIAVLFNSEAMVRAGEGMQPGATRDIVLAVARPIDDVAGAIGLHLPREGLDLAFGQEDKTASGTELERGSASILRRKPQEQAFRQPTKAEPLKVLVTGDSQAEFLGQRLIDQSPEGLLDVQFVDRLVRVTARNVTSNLRVHVRRTHGQIHVRRIRPRRELFNRPVGAAGARQHACWHRHR